MKPIYRLFAISLLLTQLAGCASVFKGTEQEMSFKSNPEGATVFVDGLEKGKTPLTIKLLKDEYKKVTLKKKGYRDHEIILTKRFDKIGLINLLTISLYGFGFTTDASTGAMFAYVPGQFYVNLDKQANNKTSKTPLDRVTGRELHDFVLLNFTSLKQQCQAQCENEHIQTLSWLLAREYQKDIDVARMHALQALPKSQDPWVYLKQLEIELSSEKPLHQVAALKNRL